MDPWRNDFRDLRAAALFLAVLRHGLSNFASTAMPASDATVIRTAQAFEHYIETGTAPNRRAGGNDA